MFHARLVDYAYPRHCHDTWTVLIVDDGAIRYDLDSRHCGAVGQTVTLLPPGVVHDGRPAPGTRGFRKRSLYLDTNVVPENLVGAAVDHTTIDDPELRNAIAALHVSLSRPEDDIDGEGRLALIAERLVSHLGGVPEDGRRHERTKANQLRHLLDEHTLEPVTLAHAAAILDRSVPHLVRSFTRQFGISPHAYVIGRRIDTARRLLLNGMPTAEVATTVGFYDQAHFTRHFKRHTSLTPSRFAASHT